VLQCVTGPLAPVTRMSGAVTARDFAASCNQCVTECVPRVEWRGLGRAASGGALAQAPPRATGVRPEFPCVFPLCFPLIPR